MAHKESYSIEENKRRNNQRRDATIKAPIDIGAFPII